MGRAARVAAGLLSGPLYVDPDLAYSLTPGQRATVVAAARAAEPRLGTPVFLVVIPNPEGTDRRFRQEAFLFDLRAALGRDGLYVVADSSGYVTDLPFGVSRRIESVDSLTGENIAEPHDPHRPFDDLGSRLVELLGQTGAAPTAEPTAPYWDSTPLAESAPKPPNRVGNFLLGLLLLGPIAGAVLFLLTRLFTALARRIRPAPPSPSAAPAYPHAPAEPTARRLRPLREKALEALREAIDADAAEEGATNPGRAYALRALDAALLVSADLAAPEAADVPDGERILSQVGVIVLARLGTVAILDRTARPAVPCALNPLHGPSVRRVKWRAEPLFFGTYPLCDACVRRNATERTKATLIVSGEVYLMVKSPWTDIGYSSADLVPRILEHLGVDDQGR